MSNATSILTYTTEVTSGMLRPAIQAPGVINHDHDHDQDQGEAIGPVQSVLKLSELNKWQQLLPFQLDPGCKPVGFGGQHVGQFVAGYPAGVLDFTGIHFDFIIAEGGEYGATLPF